MLNFKNILVALPLTLLITSCATTNDIERLESKIDLIVQTTQRSSLDEIFGDQTVTITKQLNQLGSEQTKQFEKLQQTYAKGAISLEEVRGEMLNVLGNNKRVVATAKGVYVRNTRGDKLKAIPNGTEIISTEILSANQIPAEIAYNPWLAKFTWGIGQLEGETIIFPWELTMSTFTKEIVENTARRTAEEFIKMGGNKAWNRPVVIEVSVEEEDKLNFSTNEEDSEVFVRNSSDNLKKKIPLK